MKVLMLSTDENIFADGSGVRQRMMDYGTLVEELHVIVKSHGSRVMNKKFGNVFVYPTNDRIRWLYFINAYRISKKVIKSLSHDPMTHDPLLLTTQDPFETGLVGYLVKKRFGLPLQIQVHTDFLSPYFWRESLKNKVRVALGKWLVRKADGIRVVSERIKDSLLSLYPKPYTLNPIIVVLPIFVDAEEIKNAPVVVDLHRKYPDHDFIILMASRLTREKNIGLAIEAMRGLIQNNTRTNADKVLLLIVGDGPEAGKLKLLTTHHSLQTDVIFEPWASDLPSYYKTADLFLLTSNYEGYGRTAVEATVAGLPVLMTDVGSAIGSVVPVGSREALVDRLRLIIGNRLEREKSLESQKRILEPYFSKENYLNQIKQSWRNCFL